MRLALAFGVLALVIGLSGCNETSGGCQMAVNELSIQLKGVKAASDIDQVLVGKSLDICDGPEAWKQAAGDHGAANEVGRLSDIDALAPAAALDLLCKLYDPSNFTSPCKFR